MTKTYPAMSSAEVSPAVMGTTSGEEEKVVLRCCDGEEFAVAVSVARKRGPGRSTT